MVGSAVVTNVKYAGGAINEKIEANPTLSNAKARTSQVLGGAASYMSGLVWGSTQ